MNQTAFDVPASVVTVTCTRPAPGGATAEQEVWLAQEVGATWPPKWASTCPSVLKRLLPLICTLWPAGPEEGLIETMVGPFGEAVVEEARPRAVPVVVGGDAFPAAAGEESRLRCTV